MPDSRGDSRPRLFGGAKLRSGDVQLNDVVHVRFLRCETTGELRSRTAGSGCPHVSYFEATVGAG